MGTNRRDVHNRLTMLLAAILLANPVILFILSRSAMLAITVFLATLLVLQCLLSYRPALVIVFNVVAVASVLAHAEALLVHGFPDKVIENLYVVRDGYYFNKPLLNQTFNSEEFSVAYRTNVQGFRIGAGQEPDTRVETVDWLVLGDSFSQGAQVEFESLYSTRLSVRFPDKIIVNAAVSGMGIAEEYNYFKREGKLFRPSLVILQIGSFNDFMNVDSGVVTVTDRVMERSALARLLLYQWRFGDPAQLPLGRWTEPFYPKEQQNIDFNVFFKDSSEKKQKDLALFKQYLNHFNKLVNESGGTLLVVLLPTREQISPAAYREVTSAFNIKDSQLDMNRPNRLLAEWAGEVGFDLLDLMPAFQSFDGETFLRTDEHLNANGHQLIADMLANNLEQVVGRSAPTLLSREFSGDRYPSPSDDGKEIVYQSIRNGTSELFVAASDFSNVRRLTFNSIDDAHPMLSRDRSRVTFTEGSAASHRTKVVLVELDNSKRVTITANANEFGAIPRFSPSNLKLAYAGWESTEAGTMTSSRIVIVDLLTGDRHEIPPLGEDAWRPVFSPDQSSIVFIARFGSQYDLCLYRLESREQQRLTRTEYDEWDPQFSPDGKTVIYAARKDGNWDLFQLDLQTAIVSRISQTRGDEWDPSLSPDGRTLFFAGKFGLIEAIFSRSFREVTDTRGKYVH